MLQVPAAFVAQQAVGNLLQDAISAVPVRFAYLLRHETMVPHR